MASSLLAVPVAALCHLLFGVATLSVPASALPALAGSQSTTAPMAPAWLSEVISSRLAVATLGGFPLILVLLRSGVRNLGAARFERRAPVLERTSWVVFAALVAAGAWIAVTWTIDVQSFVLGPS